MDPDPVDRTCGAMVRDVPPGVALYDVPDGQIVGYTRRAMFGTFEADAEWGTVAPLTPWGLVTVWVRAPR